MKLEVGKKYITRHKKIVTVVATGLKSRCDLSVLAVHQLDDAYQVLTYTEKGVGPCDPQWDIAGEYTEPQFIYIHVLGQDCHYDLKTGFEPYPDQYVWNSSARIKLKVEEGRFDYKTGKPFQMRLYENYVTRDGAKIRVVETELRSSLGFTVLATEERVDETFVHRYTDDGRAYSDETGCLDIIGKWDDLQYIFLNLIRTKGGLKITTYPTEKLAGEEIEPVVAAYKVRVKVSQFDF